MKKKQIYARLLELCSIPSVSETTGELKMVEKLKQLLMEIKYFQHHPQAVQICPIKEDPYGRSFVYGFMEGGVKSKKTVILLSHFDVVGVEEFGMMKELAFHPQAYTQFLKEHPEIQLSEDARADLESDDYLFGRGTMDMKFGIAADIEMLIQAEKYRDSFEGNLLFLSVPDEEANSAGMLAATEFLLSFKRENQLEYAGCLVSEPHFPKYNGDSANYIYTGTVGKLLPVFYCVGKEAHVCEPFSGLNPNLMTSKIVEKMDANPALADVLQGSYTPAPVCLKQSDMKTAYSVQTPTAAYAYFNLMTLSRTPQEVMEAMLAIGNDAFLAVLEDIKNKAEKLKQITGEEVQLPEIAHKVIPYQELYGWCEAFHGESFQDHMQKFFRRYCEEEAQNKGDLRSHTIAVVQEVHKFSPYRDPMIVVFFAPPFYPHSDLQSEQSLVTQISRRIAALAKEHFGVALEVAPFFPGLSDMSYLGLSPRIKIQELIKNFPVWDAGYQIPLETIKQLNIPFMNVGPLGKDAHQYTERLCLSYSFEKAVPLLWAAVRLFLGHTISEEKELLSGVSCT